MIVRVAPILLFPALLFYISFSIPTGSSYGSNTSSNWLQISKSIYDNGTYEMAILTVEKSLKLNDSSPMAWHHKGKILDKLGKYEQALECYDKAIGNDPTYSFAWYDKGIVLQTRTIQRRHLLL